MFGLKQEALALELGDDWSQKKVSRMEENERVEDEVLEQVAKILKVPIEAIKNFDEETAIHNIQNNYDGSVVNAGPAINYKCNFNLLDKLMESLSENKELYERLLQSEKDKVEILERTLSEIYKGDDSN
jgi:transcriptional regulator with XRE-family HTH domain